MRITSSVLKISKNVQNKYLSVNYQRNQKSPLRERVAKWASILYYGIIFIYKANNQLS